MGRNLFRLNPQTRQVSKFSLPVTYVQDVTFLRHQSLLLGLYSLVKLRSVLAICMLAS